LNFRFSFAACGKHPLVVMREQISRTFVNFITARFAQILAENHSCYLSLKYKEAQRFLKNAAPPGLFGRNILKNQNLPLVVPNGVFAFFKQFQNNVDIAR